MKRILLAIILSAAIYTPVFADFREHFEEGQESLLQNQYSTAIIEFKKALRINFMDNSARIGLVNAYLARGAYYATTAQDWESAANDFRAAIFYLQYYTTGGNNPSNSAAIISQAADNLNKCLKMQNFNTSPANRYQKALQLRQQGKFAEAAYEFNQAALSQQFQTDSYIQLADLFKLMGNEEASLPYYAKALDSEPNNGPVRLKYARTLDRLNKEDDAVTQYNYALAQSHGDPEILYALERIYMKKIQKSPNDAELYANLGAIKQKQNDFETALRYYAKAEQINPSNVQTRLNIGTLFQQQKDYVKALQSYNSILVLYPDNIEANLYKAQALEASGEKEQAYDAYKKVLALDPANTLAKAKVNAMVAQNMSPEETLAYLKSSITKNPQMVNSLYKYAIKMHKANNIDEAIKYYREVIRFDGSNAEVYVNLAICYGQQQEYDKAAQVLNVANAKFPNNAQIKSTLANIQTDNSSVKITNASKSYSSGNYTEALKDYLSVKPATKDSLIGAAACYQGLKQFDNAISYYKQAEKIAPDDKEIKYYIGAMYTEKGDYTNAEQYLKPIANQVPQANELLTFISQKASIDTLESAISDFEAQNYDTSLSKIEQVLKTDSNNAYALYYRGMVYDAKGEKAKAIEDYKKVIQLSPDIVIANYLLAVDYDALQKFIDAYNAYSNFLNKYTNDDEYKQYAQKRLEDLKPYAPDKK